MYVLLCKLQCSIYNRMINTQKSKGCKVNMMVNTKNMVNTEKTVGQIVSAISQ